MKNLLALALINTLCLTIFGQGQVQFLNYNPASPTIIAPIYNTDGTTKLSGSDARAALLGGPVSDTSASSASAGTLSLLVSSDGITTWANFGTGNTAGFINSFANPSRVVSGVDWGGQALLQVVAWTGNYDTWQDAYAAWKNGIGAVGWSGPITVTLPSEAIDPRLSYLTGLQRFSLLGAPAAVPEPSAFVLAGLGAAALLALRISRKPETRLSRNLPEARR